MADVVGSVERADCQVRPWNMILVTYFKFKGRFQLPFLILDFGFPSTISNTQDGTCKETKPRLFKVFFYNLRQVLLPRVILPALHQVHLQPVHCDLAHGDWNRIDYMNIIVSDTKQRHSQNIPKTPFVTKLINLLSGI